jgi:hypothetical protein
MSSDGDSPAADPPPGIEPNFDHPSNRNGLIIGLVTFCLCLSMLFIFIRVYAKFIYAKKAQVQDCKFSTDDPLAPSTRPL